MAAFAGDDRYVVDYLMAEVLEREPESVRDFLRRTSILERLSAPLCDDLTGRDDSAAVLEHLEAANLFLLPLDNRREWFRYHVLFAEVLRLSLTAQEQIELAPASGRLVRGPRLARIRRAARPSRRRGVGARRNGPASHVRAPAADRAAQRARARGAAPDRRGLLPTRRSPIG